MRQIASISSVLLLGTSVAILLKNWLTPADLNFDLEDEDYHLYL